MKEAWNLRIDPTLKTLLREAASRQGRTLTNFTVHHLEREARREMARVADTRKPVSRSKTSGA